MGGKRKKRPISSAGLADGDRMTIVVFRVSLRCLSFPFFFLFLSLDRWHKSKGRRPRKKNNGPIDFFSSAALRVPSSGSLIDEICRWFLVFLFFSGLVFVFHCPSTTEARDEGPLSIRFSSCFLF